jgi:hypothetical protein
LIHPREPGILPASDRGDAFLRSLEGELATSDGEGGRQVSHSVGIQGRVFVEKAWNSVAVRVEGKPRAHV